MCVRIFHRLRNSLTPVLPWYHILSFLSLVFGALSSQCPNDAIQKMRQCTESSLPNFGLGPPGDINTPGALTEGIAMMRTSCQNSKLVEAAECMQKILDQCRGMTDQEQILQRLFDKKEIVNTARFFCNNLHLYERHAKCIQDQHEAATQCSQEVKMSYAMKITANAPMDVLIFSTCTFMDEAAACLTGHVDVNCGNEAVVFLETIVLGIRPPACDDKTPTYTKEPDIGHANSLAGYLSSLIISLVLTLVFQLRWNWL